ncbi:protein kinase [Streptomyces sp. NPDC058726]|uniref:serine/threonine-protein kinase n=1 Tax=Streptomyces sp. NPDC058726 TaxID=3346611 RepID=UPI0036A71E9A
MVFEWRVPIGCDRCCAERLPGRSASGSDAPEGRALLAGDVVDGRYRLTALLGKGGVARVWRACCVDTGRDVALKVMRPEAELGDWIDPAHPLEDLRALHDRFRREGGLLGTLDHAGIPRLYGQGMHQDSPYLAMQLVDGESLRRFLERWRPLPLQVAVAVAVQVGEALACAHEIPVVHRDLKPDNVIIDAQGLVHLVDFGIALPTRPGAARYTSHGATPGSAGYMAPEQILGNLITPRADLYAFGCVLYELLTGGRPFVPEAGRNLYDLHLNAPVPTALLHAGTVPDRIALLAEGLLAKEERDRPFDIGVVLDVLRPYLPVRGDRAPFPVPDPDPTRVYREPETRVSGPRGGRPEAVPAVQARSHRSDEWLAEEEVEAARDAARAELETEGPGACCDLLAGMLDSARSQFGPRTELVADVQLLCADAARVAGDYRSAAELFVGLARALERSSAPFLRGIMLQARLGAAECRIPFGATEEAFARWSAVVEEVAGLVEPSDAVLERCREVAVELHELGHGAEVDTILAKLDPL